MRFCWRRGVLIFFVFLVFAASLFAFRNPFIYRFFSDRSFTSHQVNITEDMILERLASSFPDIIVNLSKLSSQQQKQFIEKVRRDTIAAASASGQSDEHARKLGDTVAMTMLKAISHPSIGDAYF
ncbi:Uncharacterised protein [Candidatus Bartonella washoeensis]|uniref:Uncharacterized protein n=1 Tax=Candidatus Bartonella washoeensis Sb944nv TaxID=1094563 RepID=J0Q7M7_9HYPH|nr:hypothetical protein [Bartonella washoeensis]EJF78659.1 hypothetical protein MCQ_01038 [Bartonella washoeensis Sb944nv]SPU27401.1 Uncharacterised protein [Bartonella washoeensis]